MNSNFGNFLKEKRREKKLTQKDLAEKLFVSESAVSKWEKNIAHPDITLLPKLSEILETTEHELITASVDNKLRSEKIQAKKIETSFVKSEDQLTDVFTKGLCRKLFENIIHRLGLYNIYTSSLRGIVEE